MSEGGAGGPEWSDGNAPEPGHAPETAQASGGESPAARRAVYLGDRQPDAARFTEPLYSTQDHRTWLTYPELDLPGLVHGIVVFKELRPGLPHGEWTRAVRAYLGQSSPIAGMPLVIPHQVHGAEIGVVTDAKAADDPVLDGLVTDRPGVAVAVSVADCLPLFACDPAKPVIGVAHCGWRSISAGIVEEFVKALAALSHDAVNARFVIGAGIGPCCYHVGDDLLGEFTPEEVRRFSTHDSGATRFDLKATVARRLTGCGVGASDVIIDTTCTSCDKETLSSYRADRPNCGRMVAFMALAGNR